MAHLPKLEQKTANPKESTPTSASQTQKRTLISPHPGQAGQDIPAGGDDEQAAELRDRSPRLHSANPLFPFGSLGGIPIESPRSGGPIIWPKLRLGSMDSHAEQQADEVSEQLSQSGPRSIPLQFHRHGGGGVPIGSDLESSLRSQHGSGSPLAPTLRQGMEQKLQRDLGDVRIHTGPQSIALNQKLGARAFTFGSDIHFDKGEWNPLSSSGQKLLLHELVHTQQQSDGGQPLIQRSPRQAYLEALRLLGLSENEAANQGLFDYYTVLEKHKHTSVIQNNLARLKTLYDENTFNSGSDYEEADLLGMNDFQNNNNNNNNNIFDAFDDFNSFDNFDKSQDSIISDSQFDDEEEENEVFEEQIAEAIDNFDTSEAFISAYNKEAEKNQDNQANFVDFFTQEDDDGIDNDDDSDLFSEDLEEDQEKVDDAQPKQSILQRLSIFKNQNSNAKQQVSDEDPLENDKFPTEIADLVDKHFTKRDKTKPSVFSAVANDTLSDLKKKYKNSLDLDFTKQLIILQIQDTTGIIFNGNIFDDDYEPEPDELKAFEAEKNRKNKQYAATGLSKTASTMNSAASNLADVASNATSGVSGILGIGSAARTWRKMQHAVRRRDASKEFMDKYATAKVNRGYSKNQSFKTQFSNASNGLKDKKLSRTMSKWFFDPNSKEDKKESMLKREQKTNLLDASNKENLSEDDRTLGEIATYAFRKNKKAVRKLRTKATGSALSTLGTGLTPVMGIGVVVSAVGTGVSASASLESGVDNVKKRARGRLGLKRRQYATQLWELGSKKHRPSLEFLQALGILQTPLRRAEYKFFFAKKNRTPAIAYIMGKMRA